MYCCAIAVASKQCQPAAALCDFQQQVGYRVVPAGLGHIPGNVVHVWLHSNARADPHSQLVGLPAAVEDPRMVHWAICHKCAGSSS